MKVINTEPAEMAISPEDKIKHGLEYDKWLEAKINKTNIYSYKAKKKDK
jgi:hypothetical protein